MTDRKNGFGKNRCKVDPNSHNLDAKGEFNID